MIRNVIAVSIGVMGVLGGISIMIAYDDSTKAIGVVLILLGIYACAMSYRSATEDDNKALREKLNTTNSTEKMASQVKDLNNNIRELTDEIREDRKQRKNGKGGGED